MDCHRLSSSRCPAHYCCHCTGEYESAHSVVYIDGAEAYLCERHALEIAGQIAANSVFAPVGSYGFFHQRMGSAKTVLLGAFDKAALARARQNVERRGFTVEECATVEDIDEAATNAFVHAMKRCAELHGE